MRFYLLTVSILILALIVTALFLPLILIGGGRYAFMTWGKLMVRLLGGPKTTVIIAAWDPNPTEQAERRSER